MPKGNGQEETNVRFRYGTPEKIGGWDQLGEDKLTGAARAFITGTIMQVLNMLRSVLTEFYTSIQAGIYYDIHPIRTTITGCDFTSTTSETAVTVTFPSPHGLVDDDIVKFDAVSGVTAIGSTYTDASFEDIKFMVTSAPTSTTITITMAAAESGTQLSNSGSSFRIVL